MNFFKTLNELLTKTLCVLCCVAFSLISFAQTPNITASIEEVVVSQTNEVDDNDNYLLDYAAHLNIDIELPPVGTNETIKSFSEIIGVSFDLDVERFGDLYVDGEDLLYCYGATGHAIGTLGSGTIRVQTFFQNGIDITDPECYKPIPTKAVVGLIIDSSDKDDSHYLANFGECVSNSRSFTETLNITNAYYMLANNKGTGILTLNSSSVTENYVLPCTYPGFSVADFNRSWSHVCTSNDGSLTINWPNNTMYNDVYVSIDGGLTYESVGNNFSYTVNNLDAENYDVRVKLGAYGYGFILDDINIVDLSHEASRNWGHPTCGNSNGWLQINWVKKALNNIEISIDGGQNFVTVPAANEYYRVEDLPEGDYDIRLKWGYDPYACPTQLDDINLRDQWTHCKTMDSNSTNSIRVYPNPANKQVSIELNDWAAKNGILYIHDLTGKEVYLTEIKGNQQRLDLNIEHLNNGIYLISLREGIKAQNYMEKLIISD